MEQFLQPGKAMAAVLALVAAGHVAARWTNERI